MNVRFMKAVIDREVPMDKLLQRVLGRPFYVGSSCFCPFHDNTNTPAAKLYDDERGITLFCFTEQKSYRSSDVFTHFTNFSIQQVFNKIWNRLSDQEKTDYMDRMDSGEIVMSDVVKRFLDSLTPFKQGLMTYDDVLESILLSTISGDSE